MENIYKQASSIFFEHAFDYAMKRDIQNKKISEITGSYFNKVPFPIVDNVLKSRNLTKSKDNIKTSIIWGNSPHEQNIESLVMAIKNNAQILLCEDGFLRSCDTNANKKCAQKYRASCSLTLDTKAYYFDASKPSIIEDMLNDKNYTLSDEQYNEARRLINFIVENKLTKYNHQPIKPFVKKHPDRKCILVVDQSYGDYAVRKGMGNDKIFQKMLDDAINQNPSCDILIKVHPDTLTGTKKGYYDHIKETDNIYKISTEINPYTLFDSIEKVYVCSTQLGFEALMAGKVVHVYGMPFYAGWGVTNDYQKLNRRQNIRTVEEIFFMFYCKYTYWYNPITNKRCTIWDAMNYLLKLRKEYKGF